MAAGKGRAYRPGRRKIAIVRPVLPEVQYRRLIAQGKPIPQGTQIIQKPPSSKSTRQLRIRFGEDGSVELPHYSGEEGRRKKVTMLHVQNVPDAIRLVHHQIASVKSRVEQAGRILEEVSRLHYDLLNRWKGFNDRQRRAFTKYFFGLTEELAKNPMLLSDESKIHAIERFGKAQELLNEGKTNAAAAVMGGIESNMLNWTRKMKMQLPRLERRRAAVIDKKFEKDTRIFGSVDAMIRIFNQLRGEVGLPERLRIAKELRSISRRLYSIRWKPISQSGIIVARAAELAEKGNLAKAREYVKDANKKTILAASGVSSIYPEKLRELGRSTDEKFKKKVLENQISLFHDMMEVWWNPKNSEKSALIGETVEELGSMAKSLGRSESAILEKSAGELRKNNLEGFMQAMEGALTTLSPNPAKNSNLKN